MEELENRALSLACNLWYTHNVKDVDLVWDLVDFGYGTEHKVMNGESSIKVS